MALLVADERGRLWHGDARSMRAAYGAPFAGPEFVDYAVKNLGFAAIHRRGGSCEIRLRPGFVARGALDGVRSWLETVPMDRLMLTTFSLEGWRSELFGKARWFRWIETADVRLEPSPATRLGRPERAGPHATTDRAS
jgi:hypothetical protein